jgi:hypothetical protein
MKSLRDLLDNKDPGWPIVAGWVKAANCPVEVLPVVGDQGNDALVALQLTTRSPLGAIVHGTGGILVDCGWLRILGSGHPKLPRSLPQWNIDMAVMEPGQMPPFTLVADDVIGGFFAIDGGTLGFQRGDVVYFAPDSRKWEPLGLPYSGFVQWSMSGKLSEFYLDYRWPGWEGEVKSLKGDLGFSIYPPPGFEGEPIPKRHRGVVPVAELYRFYQDLAEQMRDLPEGSKIEFKIEDENQEG